MRFMHVFLAIIEHDMTSYFWLVVKALYSPIMGIFCGGLNAYCMQIFFFFLGGRDIHYINATITTSKKCDVHCKP